MKSFNEIFKENMKRHGFKRTRTYFPPGEVNPYNSQNIQKFRKFLNEDILEASHFIKHEMSVDDIAYVLSKIRFEDYNEED